MPIVSPTNALVSIVMMAIHALKTSVIPLRANVHTKYSTASNSASRVKLNVARDVVFKANAFPLTAAAVFDLDAARKVPVFQEAAKR
jgi:hypothetical protein